MKQKYKRTEQKHKETKRKHKRGQRPKKRRQPKRTTESNLRMMTITIVLPPSNLTLASTKLDVCHRLTQRVPPPSLMTATAWPNVCLHQVWWLSPPARNQSLENINLTRPTPTQLRSPQRGVMVQPKLFSDSTLYIYTREQKKHVNSTQTLHSTIHSADYPRVTVCRICVSNPTQSLHKQYTNPTRRRKKFHRPPARKNGKM